MKISLLIFGLLSLVLVFFLSYAIANLSILIIVVLLLGFIFSILTIINAEIGLYLLIFVVPFTQQFTLGRVGGLRLDIGTDDVFIIFILLSWLVGLARRKEPVFLKTSLNWPLAAYFAAIVFSFFRSYVRFGGGTVAIGFLHLFKYYEYVAIYFVVVSLINNFGQIKKFLIMSFIAMGFIAAVQFYCMITTGEFSLSTMPTQWLFLIAMHGFSSNATLGAYYCFFLSILIAIILNNPNPKDRLLLTLFVFIIAIALFNTYSRSAYVGLFAGFLTLAIIKEKRFFLIILLLTIISPIYMQSAVLERITFTIQAIKPLTLDDSSMVRLMLWKKCIEAFISSPLFGIGYWSFIRLVGTTSHSQYFGVLAETGIIGFSAFCWIFVRLFKNATTLLKKADTDFFKGLGLGYIMALVSLLTICIFGEMLDSFQIIGTFWFIAGLIVSANRLLLEKGEKPDIDTT